MKFNAQLAALIEQYMSKDEQWKSQYIVPLIFYVYERYEDYWEDGKRIVFLEDGQINAYRMSLAPRPETILRHRRKVKSDHNKQVQMDGVGKLWEEDTKGLEEETKTNFI